MGRRIVTEHRLAASAASARTVRIPEPDGYLGRLVKFVPVEAVALYVVFAGMVPRGRWGILLGIASVCSVATPLYLHWVTSLGGTRPMRRQVLIGTIAFPVWVLAIGGPFEGLPGYESNRFAASLLLLIVTAVFPLFAPPPGS